MEKSKIAILGAGAMGSLVGAFLIRGGADVILVDPYEAHMDTIRTTGLTMHINKEMICQFAWCIQLACDLHDALKDSVRRKQMTNCISITKSIL